MKLFFPAIFELVFRRVHKQADLGVQAKCDHERQQERPHKDHQDDPLRRGCHTLRVPVWSSLR